MCHGHGTFKAFICFKQGTFVPCLKQKYISKFPVASMSEWAVFMWNHSYVSHPFVHFDADQKIVLHEAEEKKHQSVFITNG